MVSIKSKTLRTYCDLVLVAKSAILMRSSCSLYLQFLLLECQINCCYNVTPCSPSLLWATTGAFVYDLFFCQGLCMHTHGFGVAIWKQPTLHVARSHFLLHPSLRSLKTYKQESLHVYNRHSVQWHKAIGQRWSLSLSKLMSQGYYYLLPMNSSGSMILAPWK